MARQEEHHENVGAYVLGALPDLEAIAFERHVMGCEDCRDELERLRPPAAALARAVPQAPAPASLKTSLMDTVRAESPGRKRSWRLPSFDLPRLHPATVSLSAAFLLAVGVLAGYGGFELTSDEGGSARTIAGTVDRSRTPDATATLVIPEGKGDPTLRVHGMPALPEGFLYQVWYDHGDRNTPAGTFTVAADGRGAAALPDGLEGVKRVMVTRERAPGARTPSLPGPLIMVKT
ncbi:MAG: anti-sigma factor [Thermoleophilaceae bacterium]|nr:anti-sigma factor [Thermoleophilaceae bacterium]